MSVSTALVNTFHYLSDVCSCLQAMLCILCQTQLLVKSTVTMYLLTPIWGRRRDLHLPPLEVNFKKIDTNF